MKSHWPLVLLILVAPTILFSCTSPVPVPDQRALIEARKLEPATTLSELHQGRRFYVGNCGGCHNLILPRKHLDFEWERWVGEMKVRAKLTDEEARLIRLYLLAVNDLPPEPKP